MPMTGNKEHALLLDLVRRLVSEAHVTWPSALGRGSLRGEASYRYDLGDPAMPTGEMDRRFQVRPEAINPSGDINSFAGTHQKEIQAFSVRVAYHVGGGDAIEGDILQQAKLAVQDASAIRQKLEHPSNRADGLDLATWNGTSIEYLADRIITQLSFSAYVRVRVESA